MDKKITRDYLEELMAASIEDTRKLKDGIIELRESQKETARLFREGDRKFKEIQKEIGGIGNSQEEVGLDLFRRNMKGILRKKGIMVDDISTRFKNRIRKEDGTMLEGEYDLMGINGKDIVVVEVKNKLKTDHIKIFLEKQLPVFKILFPQYKDFNLYGGVGSLIVGKAQEEQAEKAGLFVFTQGKDGNATLMNSDGFEAKIF